MGIKSNNKRGARAYSVTLTASAEPPRLVIIPGLETPSGGPVLALATGHPRRPVLTALMNRAALAAQPAHGGTV